MDVELKQSAHESVIGSAPNYRELTKNWAIHSKSDEQLGDHWKESGQIRRRINHVDSVDEDSIPTHLL